MFRGKHPSKRLSSRENLEEDLVECTGLLDRMQGRQRFKRRARRRKPMIWNQPLVRPEMPVAVSPPRPRGDPLSRLLKNAAWILLIVAALTFIIHQLTDMRFIIHLHR